MSETTTHYDDERVAVQRDADERHRLLADDRDEGDVDGDDAVSELRV